MNNHTFQPDIYFDNAATTPLLPQVFETMQPYFTEHFGNPSAIYSYGRKVKMAVEASRKLVAKLLHVTPGEIFFTSGGTESNNMVLQGAVRDLGCKHIITSPLEHHAILHTTDFLALHNLATIHKVQVELNGHIDLNHLEELLKQYGNSALVSLMHANNEIGNLLPIKKVSGLCKEYGAYFHSDCVQSVGHYDVDLSTIPIDFISASGHKFHGPKGTGIVYVNKEVTINPLLHGGGQERNMRAGTENVYGIVGFARALEIAMENLATDSSYILGLKQYLIQQVKDKLPHISFHGDCTGHSLYTVVNLAIPASEKTEMLLMNLDMNHICASGGSACSSGASVGSHVIKTLLPQDTHTALRISFSKFNTTQEIDILIEQLQKHL